MPSRRLPRSHKAFSERISFELGSSEHISTASPDPENEPCTTQATEAQEVNAENCDEDVNNDQYMHQVVRPSDHEQDIPLDEHQSNHDQNMNQSVQRHDHAQSSFDENETPQMREAQKIIDAIAKEADQEEQIDELSGVMETTSVSNTNVEDNAYLRDCRRLQDQQFKQKHLRNRLGKWELDLLHKEHECYNAWLFKTLRPSSLEERMAAAPIYGYGTVQLRVICDKDSSQWKLLTLDNVKFILARQDTNHRVGLGALPDTTHLHLPEPTIFGDQGDGFLSIATNVGCALGRVDQGGRKIWMLRTFDLQATTHNKSKAGILFGWIGGSSNAHHEKRHLDEDDESEVCESLRA